MHVHFCCKLLPECVDSQIHLFADDCLLYRLINSPKDNQILQQDLNNLQKWARDWGMKFCAIKCYLLSTKTKSSQFYTVYDHILQQVQGNPYFGITFLDDPRWGIHTNNISKKSNSTTGFFRRNPCHCHAGRMPTWP